MPVAPSRSVTVTVTVRQSLDPPRAMMNGWRVWTVRVSCVSFTFSGAGVGGGHGPRRNPRSNGYGADETVTGEPVRRDTQGERTADGSPPGVSRSQASSASASSVPRR